MSVFLLPVHMDLRDRSSKTFKKKKKRAKPSAVLAPTYRQYLALSGHGWGKGRNGNEYNLFKQYALLHQETTAEGQERNAQKWTPRKLQFAFAIQQARSLITMIVN